MKHKSRASDFSIELLFRKISLGCRRLLGEDADGVQCAECAKLGEVSRTAADEPIDLVSDDEEPEQAEKVKSKEEEDCQSEPDAGPVLEEKEVDEAIEKLTSSVKLPKEKGKDHGTDKEADPSGQHVESDEKATASTVDKQEEDEPVVTHEALTTPPRSSRGQDSSFLCRGRIHLKNFGLTFEIPL